MFKEGDIVRLKGEFLRSTGQYAGGDANSKWKVLVCKCARPCNNESLVMVNEKRSDMSYWDDEEVAARPCLQWRTIHQGNLELVKKR